MSYLCRRSHHVSPNNRHVLTKDIPLRVLPQQAANEHTLRDLAAEESGTARNRIHGLRIIRRSIDARQRQVMVNVTVRLWIDEPMSMTAFEPIEYHDVADRPTAVVVGAGPGGLFAALRLIELGIRPIVVERGRDVRSRKKDIARISREHVVDPESNYSFGEGGAGAFSDGKLYTRSKKRGSVEKVLRVFCQHGAQTDILVDAHPHIGTDRLPRVIENMRETILRCGGEVHFQTRMVELLTDGDSVVGCRCLRSRCDTTAYTTETDDASGVGSTEEVEFLGPVILATGHSARDVYRMFAARGFAIEAKGIAVGVRLEHPSQLIDQIQYHSRQGRGQWLPAAEYAFVQQVQDRGVYSFCMCPGGFVVPAATGPEQVVVNGMSPSHRAGRWSNSGMVVEVRPEDLVNLQFNDLRLDESSLSATLSEEVQSSNRQILSVLSFQEHLERLAWQQGGRRQTAPAQRMADFVNGRLSAELPESSYAPGLVASPLHFWLPKPIASRLQEGFKAFGRKSQGFLTNEATVIGVETRTSAPCRILRDAETLQHVVLKGLYPCGEGAGYAGGIVSAAIDGERCAESLAAFIAGQ